MLKLDVTTTPASKQMVMKVVLCIVMMFSLLGGGIAIAADSPDWNREWKRHIIDDSSRGADGVRLADVNRDRYPDLVTGWEEGGVVRVYINPGQLKAKVTKPWPAVTVGKVGDPEDAVFADLDGDGAVDVVSCCEGKTMSIFVHWAPKNPKKYLNSAAWETEPFPATKGKTRWIFALPMQIDDQGGVDLVVGAKGKNAMVGWLQSPVNPRKLGDWKLHWLYSAGWIMSLVSTDVDGDNNTDLILSDRKGKSAGILWLKNPGGNKSTEKWSEHRIGADGREVMFLDVVDLDGDGRSDVLAAVKTNEIHWFRCPEDPSHPWPAHVVKVELPAGTGTAKGIRAGDINGDSNLDVVYSCEDADPPKRGLVWLQYTNAPTDAKWVTYDISGPQGVKFDLVQLVDLDGDYDLDVLSCEERSEDKGLGVVWYENPLNQKERPKQFWIILVLCAAIITFSIILLRIKRVFLGRSPKRR